MQFATGQDAVQPLDYPVYKYGVPNDASTFDSRDLTDEAALQALDDALGTPTTDATFPAFHGADGERGQRLADAKRRIAELEELLRQQHATSVAALEDLRRESAERERRGIHEAMVVVEQEHKSKVSSVLEAFQSEHDRYFSRVEKEVVRLSLAIAARILHRETQMDPLLLRGAVHAALGRLTEKSGVVLKVPSEDIAGWQSHLEQHPEVPVVDLVADSRLAQGDCTLETKVGTIELGVQAQLEEIERGFFDLLDCRPAASGSGGVEQA
jgi:flagellar assembly protein FliH